MPDITIHTIETAPEEVKDVLQTVKDANGGFIPNLIGLLANAPTALETYRTVGEINRRNSLTPHERAGVKLFKLQLLLLMAVPSVWQVTQPFQSSKSK